MGPRGIEASTLFSLAMLAHDFEDDVTYLPSDYKLYIGDADIIHNDTTKSHSNIKFGVKKF